MAATHAHQQVRDWLYVADHCAALRRVLEAGRPGATYNIGGSDEMANLDVVRIVCGILDELAPALAHTRQLAASHYAN